MVDLIQEFPGVVVTHDFFLSNIAYVSEFVEGKKNVYSEEVYDSHGMRRFDSISERWRGDDEDEITDKLEDSQKRTVFNDSLHSSGRVDATFLCPWVDTETRNY